MPEPDFRALCAELVSAFDCVSDSEDASGYERLKESIEDLRAALAQPAPEPPTDEEILDEYDHGFALPLQGSSLPGSATSCREHHVNGLRAVLARWGQGNG